MSSHHIVREKQEPALLVLGLDNFSEELLGQMLEWSPTVIVTNETAEKFNAFGIKIDWLITNEVSQGLQSDVKMMPLGNDTSAEAALKYLVSHGYHAVNVITDELELKEFLFFADKINLVIFNEHQKIYAVTSGFSKWKPKGDNIKLLTHPHGLSVSGLEVVANHEFKTTHDGFFCLKFEEPFLFIAENL